MKKLLTLVVASCMVLGTLGTASAIDVKVNGQWQFSFGYYSHNGLVEKGNSGQDRTRFRQRLRTQVRFIADENLSALLNFEIGDLNWGGSGGALDADSTSSIKVKHAYLDWTLPNTQVKTRIGIQGLRLPWVVAGNVVMDADVAGITVNSQLTPELGLTVFWARPFDRNWTDGNSVDGYANKNDEMDMFGFMLPIKTDVVRATPWAMLALIGEDSGWYGSRGVNSVTGASGNASGRGRAPVNPSQLDSTGYAWWAGTTFELPVLDPFFVKIDAMMGGLESGDSDTDSFGYFLSGDIGYKFSFGRLSAIGWYSSGDKDRNDRGIMPIVSDDNGWLMGAYGLSGQRWRNFDATISNTGLGMWGAGLQLADISFVENLKHTIRAIYMGGTNDGSALAGSGAGNKAPWTASGSYFLTSDHAWEVNLMNEYKVSQNLTIALDFAYAKLELGEQRTNKDDTEGSFAAMLGIQYAF